MVGARRPHPGTLRRRLRAGEPRRDLEGLRRHQPHHERRAARRILPALPRQPLRPRRAGRLAHRSPDAGAAQRDLFRARLSRPLSRPAAAGGRRPRRGGRPGGGAHRRRAAADRRRLAPAQLRLLRSARALRWLADRHARAGAGGAGRQPRHRQRARFRHPRKPRPDGLPGAACRDADRSEARLADDRHMVVRPSGRAPLRRGEPGPTAAGAGLPARLAAQGAGEPRALLGTRRRNRRAGGRRPRRAGDRAAFDGAGLRRGPAGTATCRAARVPGARRGGVACDARRLRPRRRRRRGTRRLNAGGRPLDRRLDPLHRGRHGAAGDAARAEAGALPAPAAGRPAGACRRQPLLARPLRRALRGGDAAAAAVLGARRGGGRRRGARAAAGGDPFGISASPPARIPNGPPRGSSGSRARRSTPPRASATGSRPTAGGRSTRSSS